jgi:hypothetical protein
MQSRLGLVPFLLLTVQGCFYTSYTTKLDEPVIRTPPVAIDSYVFLQTPSKGDAASIGEDLFVISRFKEGVGE